MIASDLAALIDYMEVKCVSPLLQGCAISPWTAQYAAANNASDLAPGSRSETCTTDPTLTEIFTDPLFVEVIEDLRTSLPDAHELRGIFIGLCLASGWYLRFEHVGSWLEDDETERMRLGPPLEPCWGK